MPDKVPEFFQTERLQAERISEAHLAELQLLHDDERAMAQLGGLRDPAATVEYLARNLEHWDEHGFGVWMLRERREKQPVGRVILRWLRTDEIDDVEIGFALLPAYWGLGIATEAAQFCLNLARENLGLQSLVATTTSENSASQNVLRKLGFAYQRPVSFQGTPWLLYRLRW